MASPLVHSEPIRIGPFTSFGFHVQKRSAKTWASAVVELQFSYTLGKGVNWVARLPAVTVTTTTNFARNIAVVGLGFVRLRTTTAEALNDPAALVAWTLQ